MVSLKAWDRMKGWLVWTGFAKVVGSVPNRSTADHTVVICGSLFKQMQTFVQPSWSGANPTAAGALLQVLLSEVFNDGALEVKCGQWPLTFCTECVSVQDVTVHS